MASELVPLPGYQVLSSLVEDKAGDLAPARAILQQLGSVAQIDYRVHPDGSRVILLAKDDKTVVALAVDLARTLRTPVVVRDQSERIPEVELPQLLQRVTYQDTEVTVEEISVFRGEIVLRTNAGTAITVPLANGLSHKPRT